MRSLGLTRFGGLAILAIACSCSRTPPPTSDRAPAIPESPPAAEANAETESTWTPLRSADYPAPPTGLPAGLPPTKAGDTHVVLAWNDLGMHCYQADFSRFQILPPYNVFWAQVVARGEKPAIVTEGIQVDYGTLNVAQPERHTNFWKYAAGYGWKLRPGVGLKGHRTSGTMEAAADHFVAEGVPVVDFTDAGGWDPFPMFTVSVKDGRGQTVAETLNVAPASTEMACDLCHTADTMQGTMAAILKAHDANEKTDLLSQAESGKPVMCSVCHADPAMGATENKDCERTLSAAMHGFHATKLAAAEVELPKNQCHACHPGPKTNCLRDVMSQSGITCTNCHGGMEDLGDPAQDSVGHDAVVHDLPRRGPRGAGNGPNQAAQRAPDGRRNGPLPKPQGSRRRGNLLRRLPRLAPCRHTDGDGARQRAGRPAPGACRADRSMHRLPSREARRQILAPQAGGMKLRLRIPVPIGPRISGELFRANLRIPVRCVWRSI